MQLALNLTILEMKHYSAECQKLQLEELLESAVLL
jgi:hypothetical protein